jgi:hypothetical protein
MSSLPYHLKWTRHKAQPVESQRLVTSPSPDCNSLKYNRRWWSFHECHSRPWPMFDVFWCCRGFMNWDSWWGRLRVDLRQCKRLLASSGRCILEVYLLGGWRIWFLNARAPPCASFSNRFWRWLWHSLRHRLLPRMTYTALLSMFWFTLQKRVD